MENHHHHNRELSQPITWDTESCLHTALQLSAPRPGCVLAQCSLWQYQSGDAAAVQHLTSQHGVSMACMLIQALKTFPMKLFLQLSLLILILSRSKWRVTGEAKGGPNHTMPFFQETKSPSKYYQSPWLRPITRPSPYFPRRRDPVRGEYDIMIMWTSVRCSGAGSKAARCYTSHQLARCQDFQYRAGAGQHCTVQYSTVQYSTVQYNIVQEQDNIAADLPSVYIT